MAKTKTANGTHSSMDLIRWANDNPEDKKYLDTGRNTAMVGAGMIACGTVGRVKAHTVMGKLAADILLALGWLTTCGGGLIMGEVHETYARDMEEAEAADDEFEPEELDEEVEAELVGEEAAE